MPFRGAPQLLGIGEHRRVSQLGFDCGELVLEGGESFEHESRLRGDRDDLSGIDEATGDPLGDRVHITLREGQDQPRSGIDREPGIRCERHEVEVDADRAHDDKCLTALVSTVGHRGTRSVAILAT